MIPGADIVIGLFIQLIVWVVLRVVRALVKLARSAIFEHPVITVVILKAGLVQGWWGLLLGSSAEVWLWTYYPPIALGLALVAVARFIGDGGPAAVGGEAMRAGRFLRDLAAWRVVGDWVDDKREERDRTKVENAGYSRGVEHDQAADGQGPLEHRPGVLDVHEVPNPGDDPIAMGPVTPTDPPPGPTTDGGSIPDPTAPVDNHGATERAGEPVTV